MCIYIVLGYLYKKFKFIILIEKTKKVIHISIQSKSPFLHTHTHIYIYIYIYIYQITHYLHIYLLYFYDFKKYVLYDIIKIIIRLNNKLIHKNNKKEDTMI